MRELRHGSVLVEVFENLQPSFREPCDSALTGVFDVRNTQTRLMEVPECGIDSHAIHVPQSIIDPAHAVEGTVIKIL